jgi:hypothetical protein
MAYQFYNPQLSPIAKRMTSITSTAKLIYHPVNVPVKLQSVTFHQDAAVTGSANTIYVGQVTGGSNTRLISISIPTSFSANKVTRTPMSTTFGANDAISLETDGGGSGAVNLDFTLFTDLDLRLT